MKQSFCNLESCTHGVVFLDVAPDVEQQFVADVDGLVDGTFPTGQVAAAQQTGLTLQPLKHRQSELIH